MVVVTGGRVIARGGSSSPGLYTSHTGAGDAPCSGPTHPGHQVSPEVAVNHKTARQSMAYGLQSDNI